MMIFSSYEEALEDWLFVYFLYLILVKFYVKCTFWGGERLKYGLAIANESFRENERKYMNPLCLLPPFSNEQEDADDYEMCGNNCASD